MNVKPLIGTTALVGTLLLAAAAALAGLWEIAAAIGAYLVMSAYMRGQYADSRGFEAGAWKFLWYLLGMATVAVVLMFLLNGARDPSQADPGRAAYDSTCAIVQALGGECGVWQ